MQNKIIIPSILFAIINSSFVKMFLGLPARAALLGIAFYFLSGKLYLTRADIMAPVMLSLIIGSGFLPKCNDIYSSTLIFMISLFTLRRLCPTYF